MLNVLGQIEVLKVSATFRHMRICVVFRDFWASVLLHISWAANVGKQFYDAPNCL